MQNYLSMAFNDDMLCMVADAISKESEIERFGKKLGFDVPQIRRYIDTNLKTNIVTTVGTLAMLRDWAMKVPIAEVSTQLKTALMNADLVRIAEKINAGQQPRTEGTLTDTDVNLFAEDLKRYYIRELTDINVPPSVYKIEQMYINLLLQTEYHGYSKEVNYDEFIEILSNENEKSRILLTGQAGVGKTTLLSKIAYDWATGKRLQDIKLLLLVILREKVEKWGEILSGYLSDKFVIAEDKVNEYIKKNERKVIILLDGWDEYKGSLTNDKACIVQAVIGKVFPGVPIVITTRPSRARDFMSMDKKYMYIDVQGFKSSDVEHYINKFFTQKPDAAKSLIALIRKNRVIPPELLSVPIFCCMICQLWKEEPKRQAMEKLETYSQVIEEMIYSLIEQYNFKVEDKQKVSLDACNKASQIVGKVAFSGLKSNKLLFEDEDFEGIKEDLDTVVKVGILSQRKIMLKREVRKATGKLYRTDTQFPHKLFQEHLAGCYVASLHQSDQAEFGRLLEEEILDKYEEFRYFLYFLAAQDENAGKALMEAVCRRVLDKHFIMDVAYECHNENALAPVVDYWRQKSSFNINLSFVESHSLLGYMYSWTTCLRRLQRERKFPQIPDATEHATASQYEGAMGLFTLPKLRSVEIHRAGDLRDSFYYGISEATKYFRIENMMVDPLFISHRAVASEQFARGIFSMPKLRSLTITRLEVHESFYAAMSLLSATSQIRNLTLEPLNLKDNESASVHYAKDLFSMPNLRSLKLRRPLVHDSFFAEMSGLSAKSKIEKLEFNADWPPTVFSAKASHHFAISVFSMPSLRSLTVCNALLGDSFYKAMSGKSATSQIRNLTLLGRFCSIPLSAAASEHYATGLSTMSNLRSLTMETIHLHESFFTTMSSDTSQITTLHIRCVTMTRVEMSILVSLSCLKTLKLKGIEYTEHGEACADREGTVSSPVEILKIKNIDWNNVLNLGLPGLCPRVKQLELRRIRLYSHLHDSNEEAKQISLTLNESCGQLEELFIRKIQLGNEGVRTMLQTLKGHVCLQTITIERCDTDRGVDSMCNQINRECRMTVHVTHGEPEQESIESDECLGEESDETEMEGPKSARKIGRCDTDRDGDSMWNQIDRECRMTVTHGEPEEESIESDEFLGEESDETEMEDLKSAKEIERCDTDGDTDSLWKAMTSMTVQITHGEPGPEILGSAESEIKYPKSARKLCDCCSII